MVVYDESALGALIPHPARDANKYSRGHVLLVGGSSPYPGAVALAAQAAQRSGAGYTEAFVDENIQATVQGFRASVVVRAWSECTSSAVKRLAGRPHAFVVGCGFDARDAYAQSVFQTVLRAAEGPVLVDGGALRMLASKQAAKQCGKRGAAGSATVLTPHAGEADALAQVAGIPSGNPRELSQALSQAYSAICVLKGPDTYISDGRSNYRMDQGGPELAKAGTGDVLAGAIGALLAQGVGAYDAAVLGTHLHAKAARLAADELGDVSVVPEDVLERLPQAICAFAKG